MGMEMNKDKLKRKRIVWHASIFCGTIISIWSVAAFLSGLSQVNWQVSELLRQYLIAAGLMQEFHTLKRVIFRMIHLNQISHMQSRPLDYLFGYERHQEPEVGEVH